MAVEICYVKEFLVEKGNRHKIWHHVVGGGVGVLIVCRGLYGVCLWKYIRKGWDVFCRLIIFKVGDGSSIKFWHDPWCEGLPLDNIFPELYNIANDKYASVAELLSLSEKNYHLDY